MLTKAYFVSDTVAQESLTYRVALVIIGAEARETVLKGVGKEGAPKVAAKKLEDALIDKGRLTEEEEAAVKRHEYATIILSSFTPFVAPFSDVHINELETGHPVWALFKGPLDLPDGKTRVKWKFAGSPQTLQSPEYQAYSLFPYLGSASSMIAAMKNSLEAMIKRRFIGHDVDSLMLRPTKWWEETFEERGVDAIINDLATVIGKDIVFEEPSPTGPEVWTSSATFLGREIEDIASPFQFESLGYLVLPLLLANPYTLVDPRYFFQFPAMDLVVSVVQKTPLDTPWRYRSYCHEVIRALELKDGTLLSTPNVRFKFDTPDNPTPEGSTLFPMDRVASALYSRSNVIEIQAKAETLNYGVGWQKRKVPNVFREDMILRKIDSREARSYLGEVTLSFQNAEGTTEVATIDRVEEDRSILDFCVEWGRRRGPHIPLLPELYVGEETQADPGLLKPIWSPEPSVAKGTPALSTGQEKALWNLYNSHASAVAGPPGTGKTYLIRKIQDIRREMGEDTFLIVLSPTNRGVQRVYENLAEGAPAFEDIHVFGRELEEEGSAVDIASRPRLDYVFKLATGTLSSFITKVTTDSGFANLLKTKRRGFYAIDEMSMTSPREISKFVRFLQECDRDNVTLLGDPYQLPSVDPGNAFTDSLRVLPTTLLGEHEGDQKRFSGHLATLFKDTRTAMSLCEGRHQLVRGIEDGGPQMDRHGRAERRDNGYVFPDDNLHVYTFEEKGDTSFEGFAAAEWKIIKTIYRVISEWYRDTSPLDEEGDPIDRNSKEKISIPKFPPKTMAEFNFLQKAILFPNKPFVIVPYYYKHVSTPEIYNLWKGYDPGATQIRYLSSARRINEWLVSMLAGDFGGFQPWWNYVPRAGKDPRQRTRYPLHARQRFPAVNFEGLRVDPRAREVQKLFAPWDIALRHHQGLIYEDDILAVNQSRRQIRSAELFVTQRHNGILPPMLELEQGRFPPKSVLWFLSHYHRPYFVFHPNAPFGVEHSEISRSSRARLFGIAENHHAKTPRYSRPKTWGQQMKTGNLFIEM